MSIDHEAGTCFVRYVSYGNEEEQELKDLLKSAPKPKIVQKESDAEVNLLSCHLIDLLKSAPKPKIVQKESDAEVKSFYPDIFQLLA